MSRSGVARTRHLRHRALERAERCDTLNDWLAERATALAATGNAVTFTAANATNTLTAVGHGLVTGDGPLLLAAAAASTLPAGLTTGPYWAIRTGADTFQLAESRAAARMGVAVAFTDNGTGTLTFAWAAETASDVFEINRAGHRPETIQSLTDIDTLR